jgi:dihydroorotase
MRLIYNAQLALEDEFVAGYVVTAGDEIKQVAAGMPDGSLMDMCDSRIDAQGAILMPGVIDTHVHFREPGLTHKASIASESRAAVAGGVTSYIDMPNVVPPTVTIEALEDKWDRAAKDSMANYSFYIGATASNTDMLIHDIDYTRVPGVKVFLGSSTGGMLVDDAAVLRRIFGEVPALIAVHSEDETMIRQNLERAKARYGVDIPMAMHPLIRSEEACFECTRRAVELARELNTRLHVLHVTTARELELFYKLAEELEEKRITAEACVGHLWFSDEDYARLGTRIKVNPAIKSDDDRAELRDAVTRVIGCIDVVSTDHAPHTLEEKCQKYLKSPSGMPLAQFSLVAMLQLTYEGWLSKLTVVERMCHAPARLFGIANRGFLRPGYKADMVLVEEVPQGWIIDDDDVRSSCRWTPLKGATMHHRVARTWVNGVEVYPNKPSFTPAQPLRFTRNA